VFYTGYENYQEEELLVLAFAERHMLALELAKRITNHRHIPRMAWVAERNALVGVGGNPIPNPSEGEYE